MLIKNIKDGTEIAVDVTDILYGADKSDNKIIVLLQSGEYLILEPATDYAITSEAAVDDYGNNYEEKQAIKTIAQMFMKDALPTAVDADILKTAAIMDYPEWETLTGTITRETVPVLAHEGKLYRVLVDTVWQAHQPPGGTGMLSVYRPIEIGHTGTLSDPMPYVYGMDCRTGLYYSYEGTVYICKGDMIPCVWLPGTPGLWQWEVAS